MSDLRSPEHRVLQKLMIELREATTLNQVQFAKRLDWQKSTLERIEAGHQIPSALQTRQWAIACGITPYAFTYRLEARLKPEK